MEPASNSRDLHTPCQHNRCLILAVNARQILPGEARTALASPSPSFAYEQEFILISRMVFSKQKQLFLRRKISVWLSLALLAGNCSHFKILLMAYKILRCPSTSYLPPLSPSHQPSLLSSFPLVQRPFSSHTGDRAFSAIVPKHWNEFSSNFRSSPNVSILNVP